MARTFDVSQGAEPGDTETTAIDVDPAGTYAAVTKTILSGGDCNGSVLFVQLSDGDILSEVSVGECPDSVAFSPNGLYAGVANENDREKNTNKPADEWGGSVSILDLSGGPTGATEAKRITVATALDSEPESIKIAPDNDTVVFTVEESSQVGIFNISEMNDDDFSVTYVDLPDGSEPDGFAIDENGAFVVTGNEKSGYFSVISLPAGEIITSYNMFGDVPDTTGFCKDLTGSTKQIEPEESVIVRQMGAIFWVSALQESSAVIAYNLSNLADPVFDSIAKAGITDECKTDGGVEDGSNVGSEGLACSANTGVCFSANEREGTITMFRMTPQAP